MASRPPAWGRWCISVTIIQPSIGKSWAPRCANNPRTPITGSYEETARRLHLDPRTVRTKVTAWPRRQRG